MGAKDPVGSLDGAYSSPGQLQLSGWAGDPDGTATTRLRIYYDDELEPQLEPRTSQARPDVQRAFPRLSATTGFSVTLPITPGVHTICIVGENTGPAGLSFADLGCVHGTVPSSRAPAAHDPRGGLDSMTRHAANVTNAVGWAYDPDTGGPVTVKVRILAMKAFSGNVYPDRYLTLTSRATTGVARPDVQAVYPAAGASSGFDSAMVTSGGPVRVACAYALNVGPGVNRLLGCLFAPAP